MAPMQPAHWWALARVLDRSAPPLIPVQLAPDHFRLRLVAGDVLCLQDCLRARDFDSLAEIRQAADHEQIRLADQIDHSPTPP